MLDRHDTPFVPEGPMRPTRRPVDGEFGGFMPGPRPRPTSPILHNIPVFHEGTNYVQKTGPAILEKGEAVIPKEKNMHGFESTKDVLGGHESHKPPKKIKEIRHRHGADGSHIFEHHHHHPEHHPMEEHTAHNDDAAVNHFMEHATSPNPGEAEANAGQGMQPPAGAGEPGMVPGV